MHQSSSNLTAVLEGHVYPLRPVPNHRKVSRPKLPAEAVRTLQRRKPWRAAVITVAYLTPMGFLGYLSLTSENSAIIVLASIAFGVIYASWLSLMHDAIHGNFFGIRWLEHTIMRLTSYPLIWNSGTYAEIHHLHHARNGCDLGDPERVQYSKKEYENASDLHRFYIRNQPWIDAFVFLGYGSFFRTATAGFRNLSRRMIVVGAIDFIGIAFFASVCFALFGLRYSFLLWVNHVIAGFIHQVRAHIEHNGVWESADGFFNTQIASCKNILTSKWLSHFMAGLNYHTIHHIYPNIPYYNLEKAHDLLKGYCAENGLKTPHECGSYWQSWLQLVTEPTKLIDEDASGFTQIELETQR